MKKKWIFLGIVIVVFLPQIFDFLHEIYNMQLKSVTLSCIGDRKTCLKVPVKAVKRKVSSIKCYQYNVQSKEDPFSSGMICYYHEEEQIYIVFSKMSLLFTFVHTFMITDPQKKQTLIHELKQIQPDKIIK